ELSDQVARLKRRLLVHIRLERWYARKCNYSWIEPDSPTVARERFVSRRGDLKKRVWSVLYLDARTDTLTKLRKHMGPMMAAGIAAGWATFATIFIWSYLSFQGY